MNGALNFTFLTYKFLQFQNDVSWFSFFLNAFIRVEFVFIRGWINYWVAAQLFQKEYLILPSRPFLIFKFFSVTSVPLSLLCVLSCRRGWYKKTEIYAKKLMFFLSYRNAKTRKNHVNFCSVTLKAFGAWPVTFLNTLLK